MENKQKRTSTPCVRCKYYERDYYPGSCRYSPKEYSPVFGRDVSVPSSRRVILAREIYNVDGECSKWEKKRLRNFIREDLLLNLFFGFFGGAAVLAVFSLIFCLVMLIF